MPKFQAGDYIRRKNKSFPGIPMQILGTTTGIHNDYVYMIETYYGPPIGNDYSETSITLVDREYVIDETMMFHSDLKKVLSNE